MHIFIFIMGLLVSTMVVYGLFSMVPGQMRPPDEVVYHGSKEKSE